MAIRKKDNSFEGILDEIEFDKIPIEYIERINLVLEDGRILRIEGSELQGLDSTDDLFNSPDLNQYVEQLNDVEIIMHTEKLKEDVVAVIGPLLKKFFKDGTEKND